MIEVERDDTGEEEEYIISNDDVDYSMLFLTIDEVQNMIHQLRQLMKPNEWAEIMYINMRRENELGKKNET